MKRTTSIVTLAGACCSLASAADPTTLEPTVAPVQKIAHIYYNLASGERVVTLLGDGQTAPADTGNPSSGPIWSALVQNACANEGYSSEFFFGVDNPDPSSSLSTNVTMLDYGDIALDTVVDCIQVNWVVAHADNDSDADSVGDGVEELAGQWMVWDADNGRAINQSNRLPLVSFTLFNLPGNIAAPGLLSGYTADVDLVAFGTATDLSFEIGDSDGDCQSAAFCNSSVFCSNDSSSGPIANCDNDFDGLPDSDLDGDGLFDFSWTVRFYQPGMGNDFDSDLDTGVIAPTTADTIGVSFGFPTGSEVDNGDGTWTWNIDTSVVDAGTGEEDRFAIYAAPNANGDILYAGGFWFGGFACTGGLIADGGTGYAPPAMFQFVLYGPTYISSCNGGRTCGGNPADLNSDCNLNFFDVSLFLADYAAGGDYNRDGSTNFFDVSAFLGDFALSCP